MLNCGHIDSENWKGEGFGFGKRELISLECPKSVYDNNNTMIDYMLQITAKYYNRSGLPYLDTCAAQDTIEVIEELNNWLRTEEDKKNKKK